MSVIQIAGAFVGKAIDLILGAVLQVLAAVFNVFFFWLPDDPFASFITSAVNTLNSAAPDAIGWLNWFLPLGTVAPVLTVLIDVFLAWAAFKIFTWLVRMIATIIDGLPVIG